MTRRHRIATAAALLACSLCTVAHAAPVQYSFQSLVGPVGPAEAADIIALLGNDARVSGSFFYNSAGAYTGGSGALGFEPGFAVYAGLMAGTASYGQLSGTVAGRPFSDIVGSVAVSDNSPYQGGKDVLSLLADASPRQGQNTVPTDVPRQLQGFTVGDYTLSNVRLFWVQSAQSGDFLNSYALPGSLPTFLASVAFDFVRTDGSSDAGTDLYYGHSVFFHGVKVTAVPEPETGVLAMGGLALTGGLVLRRRRASAR